MSAITQAERDWYARSRAAQGLPLEITNPVIVGQVRAVLREHFEDMARDEVARKRAEASSICPRCGAAVFRLRHEATGRVAIIDAAPQPHGRVLVDIGAGTYALWRGGRPQDHDQNQGQWHVRHDDRCPAPRRACPPGRR